MIHRQHDDIDRTEDFQTTHKEWADFLDSFYQIAHEKEHFETTTYPMIQVFNKSKVSKPFLS